MHTILEHITKAVLAILGGLWAWVEPTLPFAGACVVAVIADMVSAWRLSARLKRQGRNTDGRLSSARAGKMIGKLIGVYTAMLLAAAIEATVLEGLSATTAEHRGWRVLWRVAPVDTREREQR